MSKYLEVKRIVYEGKPSQYSLKAGINEDTEYKELYVSIYDAQGKCVGDVFFTVSQETGEPRILITANGDGDGAHQLTVYPLRPTAEAVIEEET